MRISDWSSDVCSSDLNSCYGKTLFQIRHNQMTSEWDGIEEFLAVYDRGRFRSEEHTSELQSLMRISYAVFCLKKKKILYYNTNHTQNISILLTTINTTNITT